MKSLLKKMLLGGEPIPHFVPVGLCERQALPTLWLEGSGTPVEVTANCTIAALAPLTFAICLAGDLLDRRLFLVVRDGEKVMGRIRLSSGRKLVGTPDTRHPTPGPYPVSGLALLETEGSACYCQSRLRQQAHLLYRRRQGRKKRDPFNFQMKPSELRALDVFYMRPRPVALVTVAWGEESNLFPMDLIGPVAGGRFLLALRSTSPAIALMAASKQLALSSMPIEHKQCVYDLGKHHRKRSIVTADLPFDLWPSSCFGLPVPREALCVQEVAVVATQEIGSHTLFITEAVRETPFASGAPMAHVLGFYYDYLKRQNRLDIFAPAQ